MLLSEEEMVKENPGSWRAARRGLQALGGGALGSLAALALVLVLERRLPEPLTRAAAPPHRFIAEIAHEHLVNLTALGPRVAGTYENDVAAVRVLLEALHEIKRSANHHHRVEIDVHHADGAFPISFLDGMTNVYRGVGMVVARLSAAGARRGAGRAPAVLLNCHYDTVPDSPGASDDAAGCAVLLETARALAAGAAPLPHDVLLLFNGAEENIMQASHAFITTHKWAKDVRTFINLEACGAGGREVLFQAGPHDPWLLEVYTAVAPHPFASSLAQELFESGLVPADTDFRIFRDFGNLSGVDLAWSANGYVYHTALDDAAAVPAASLQRAGDNVLALLRGLVSAHALEASLERAPLPVYFDVVGVWGVALRGAPALAAGLALLAAAAARLLAPPRGVFLARPAWLRLLARTCLCVVASGAAGVAAAAAGGALAGLQWYSRPALLAPLAVVPAVCVSWLALRRLWRGCGWRGAAARGVCVKALLALHALLLLAAVAAGLRSGFLPALWVAALLAVDALAETPLALWSWLLPWAVSAQTWYVSCDLLQMMLPVAGRAGAAAPAHLALPGLAAALALAASSWLLPLVLAARRPNKLLYWALAASGAVHAGCLLAPPRAGYSPARPQRHMLFHTRRSLWPGPGGAGGPPALDHLYWMPDLDRNSPHSLFDDVPELRAARAMSAPDCRRLAYCGAPFYLPALSFISRAHWAPAPALPAAAPTLRFNVSAELRARRCHVLLELDGPSHVVVIVSAWHGGRLARVAGAAGGAWAVAPQPARAPLLPNNTYMLTLHAGWGRAARWPLRLTLDYGSPARAGECASLSLGGHAVGARAAGSPLGRLLGGFPAWAAPTGWTVDLHLLTV